MFKFLHAADIHLDSPLRGLECYEGAPVDQIRQASRRALENLVELAIDQSVAFVLVAGDLYDGDWKEFRTGLFFVQQMTRLREAEIPVYLIAGNHDAANKMTRRLPLPENVTVLGHSRPETVFVEAFDVAIHGQSFARGAVLDNLAAAYPQRKAGLFNIGLLHTSATGRDGHEPYAPCTLDDLRGKQYDYWALGHVHRREVLCQEPWIVFPGNVQARHIRETGPKGCSIVTVDDRHTTTCRHHALDVVRWEVCRVDAAGAATGDDLLDRLRARIGELVKQAEGRPLAVRVEMAGVCPAHRTIAAEPIRWTNEVRAAAADAACGEAWVEKVGFNTSLPAEADTAAILDGPLGELVQCVRELKAAPDDLAALGTKLADLRDKLPPELQEGADSLGLDRPDVLGSLLDQVEQMLVHQLTSRASAS